MCCGDPQEDALRWGLDVVVGTPGRLLDHVGRGTLQLSDTEFLILDEADQMLDMGFKEEMEKVCVWGVFLGYGILVVSWLWLGCVSGMSLVSLRVLCSLGIWGVPVVSWI